MYAFAKFLHLVSAILWVGGMGFVLLALRPVVHMQLQAPIRLPLMCAVLGRFFPLVWMAIALLLGTGLFMMLRVGAHNAALGWHLMSGIGLLMFLIFAHLYFAPYRQLQRAIASTDWPTAASRMGQIALLVQINFGLAWLAIAAAVFVP